VCGATRPTWVEILSFSFCRNWKRYPCVNSVQPYGISRSFREFFLKRYCNAVYEGYYLACPDAVYSGGYVPTSRRNLLCPLFDKVEILTSLRSRLQDFSETSMLIHHTILVTSPEAVVVGFYKEPRWQNKYFYRNVLVLKMYENMFWGSAHIVTFNSPFCP
jgi:hypothetical protein